LKFWWVNQNKTFKQEFEGGYLWSPKRKSNGTRNPFYEFMREVAPGDFIFSFVDTYIQAISIARSTAYEAPKPEEFGIAGQSWSKIGWRVDAHYQQLNNLIRPKEYMDELRALLPARYSPLQITGSGKELYLTHVPRNLAEVLIGLIGFEALQLRQLTFQAVKEGTDQPRHDVAVGQVEWENYLLNQIRDDKEIPDTDREAIVIARRGQGRFKEAVMKTETRCRITQVDRIEHLRASHIRPWRDCEDHRQRLDGSNGLLLTPSIDHLFDRGFISFENDGELLISPVAHRDSLNKMGVETDRVVRAGGFDDEQKHYLGYHREQVFLQAQVRR